jgi:hypothetical protein
MVAAMPAQPQAAVVLAVGAIFLGVVAALYAGIAVVTASGRRELDRGVEQAGPEVA